MKPSPPRFGVDTQPRTRWWTTPVRFTAAMIVRQRLVAAERWRQRRLAGAT
jgi:hypothetical protein